MDIGTNAALGERKKRKKTTKTTIGTKGERVQAIV